MSSQSSPRRSSTKDSSPQRNATKDSSTRRSSIKDTSPKRSTSKDTSPKRSTSKDTSPRRGSTKDVSGRRGSSFSPSKLSPKVSPTNRRKASLKNSPSPDRAKGGSGAVTRKSLSPVKSGFANRKRSPSLSKTLSSKSLIKDQSAASSRGKNHY
ncbi:mediator of RNA polymerase II transcription subunit 1 [Biomphalaria pfeifferi]|uniref:Mediator of RNA polymerase II transcription subunit 1 n=1 Tax=Biomphalaria pfeifferi TaxID=112525 RepID=A0AAD8F9N5_BIOPF|nr:mediator of RNA polymerase II transcription subunit 1 [Biomphalaria pfeifferi]